MEKTSLGIKTDNKLNNFVLITSLGDNECACLTCDNRNLDENPISSSWQWGQYT